ncbi:MAG: nuclear transport factor 2 family protein [Methyloligellaceae bacterium]
MTAPPSPIEAYLDALQSLKPETIADLMALCRPDVRFKDPFNDVQGQADFAHVLQHMFRKLSDLRFVVTRRSGGGEVWFLAWHLHGRSRLLGKIELDGTSLIVLDENGKVASHIDHWDATEQLYGRLPVIGGLFRIIRRAFRA